MAARDARECLLLQLDALEEDDHPFRSQGDDAEHARALRVALANYREQGDAAFEGFRDALKTYVEQEWHHMNTEEGQIFPLAKAHLTPEDWAEIDAAFLANDNPWQGAAGEYAALFSRIVNIAPSPVGLGG